jgi:alkanesulfonate monooxygenase SsuD/methylene tetrahydromethanopterin reductase-like flavin-dependent oxidoreductase (luciferase family)
MHVGLAAIFQNPGKARADFEVYRQDLRLADLAEPLGFESVWGVEHHFTDYTMCPDVLQFLAYMAGRTERVQLGSMVVVLPWHDPLRVAEQVAVLDHLSRGRLRLGIGRGLARREFEAFRGTMDESRERFDEAADMILRALRTGVIEGDGPFYRQPRTEIRPRPTRSFDGRVYAVASSDDSVVAAARLNAHMVMFADRPWPMRLPAIQKHRALVREQHGMQARPPLLADFCVCTPTLDGAEALARQYMGKFVESNFYHYELLGPHFSTVKGYDAYAQKIALAREIGMEGIVSAFMEAAVWGTPERILRKLEERRGLVGDFELATSFRFGGTPYDLAETGLRLYAKEVVPVVRAWTTTSSTVARSA